MRVLLFSQFPPPNGGIASWSEQFMQYCKNGGFEAEKVNNALVGRRAENISSAINLLDELMRFLKVRRELKQKLRSFRPDVIHFNTPCSPRGVVRDWIYMRMIGRRAPVLLNLRCTPQEQLNGSRIGLSFLRMAMKRSAAVLVLNSKSKEYIERITNKPCMTMPLFINDEDIADGRKQIAGPVKEVLYAGHLKREKGIDEILQVARALPHIHFTLAGSLDAEYRSAAYPPNVDVLNDLRRQQVLEMLDRSDVFLFPSHTEGFSNALLEAMARGVPCVATDVGANRDMLEDQGGIITAVNEPEALVRALIALEDPELREQMSKWSVRKVHSSYAVSSVMKRLFALYENVLAGAR